MTTYTTHSKQSRMNRQERLTPAEKAETADRILYRYIFVYYNINWSLMRY